MNDEDKTPRPEPGPEEDGTTETEEMRDRGREVGLQAPARFGRPIRGSLRSVDAARSRS